jgi:hypothetical protein
LNWITGSEFVGINLADKGSNVSLLQVAHGGSPKVMERYRDLNPREREGIYLLNFISLISFLVWVVLAHAEGGPPMITDDPHTVGPNNWEINIAQLSVSGAAGVVFQNPYFDVNYGVGEDIQLKFESGVSSVIPTALPVGGSYATTGVRYRFFHDQEKGIEISTYPQYAFYPSYYGTNSAVNMTQTSFFLPLEFSKTFGEYTFNPELGYGFVRGDDNFWALGLLVSKEMNKKWSLMFELHFQTPVGLSQSQNVANMGTKVDLTERYTVLFSVGESFATTLPYYWVSYTGIQIHF